MVHLRAKCCSLVRRDIRHDWARSDRSLIPLRLPLTSARGWSTKSSQACPTLHIECRACRPPLQYRVARTRMVSGDASVPRILHRSALKRQCMCDPAIPGSSVSFVRATGANVTCNCVVGYSGRSCNLMKCSGNGQSISGTLHTGQGCGPKLRTWFEAVLAC